MLRWFEHAQVYHPDRVLTATGAELGRPFEDVAFTTNDGVELHGWYYPARRDSARGHLGMLVCHGNGGNIGDRLDLCKALLATGVNVFMFDYRGYGRSQGRPSEEGTYSDAQAAHHWMKGKGLAATNIIAYGESLGGGIVSELAVRETLGGLVLQSTFSSLPDLGAEMFPWLPVRWMGSLKYESCLRLPRIKIPVMVMHSRQDDLIGFHHAEKNYALANEPKSFCEIRGGHNDSLLDPNPFTAGMEKFLRLVESIGTPNVSSHKPKVPQPAREP